MNIVSSAGIFIALAGICLDRLPKRRSALQKPDSSCDLPPQRGSLGRLLYTVGSELARAVCQSASKLADLRNYEFLGAPLRSLSVKARCFATTSRAHSEHLSQPGEAGTKNFAGKSESRNSYRGCRPTSDNPKQNGGKGEKKQSGRLRFKLFPRSDFYFVSKFELRILNLEIWCILREISRVSG